MSTMWKLRLGLIAAGVLVAGIVGAYQALLGKGELHVLQDEEQRLEVTIDGQPAVATRTQGRHLRYDVAQGTHQVKLKDTGTNAERTLSVNVSSGYTQLVLPVSEEQCFTRLDVTKTMYEGVLNQGGKLPTISGRYEAQGVFDLASETYFSTEEMPEKLKRGRRAHLLLPTPCELLKLEDGKLLQLAGFKD